VAAQVGIRRGGDQQEVRWFYVRVYYEPAVHVTARNQRRLEKRAALKRALISVKK